jgi:hypothetical protein
MRTIKDLKFSSIIISCTDEELGDIRVKECSPPRNFDEIVQELREFIEFALKTEDSKTEV